MKNHSVQPNRESSRFLLNQAISAIFTLYHGNCVPELLLENVWVEHISDPDWKLKVAVLFYIFSHWNLPPTVSCEGRPLLVRVEGNSLL